MPAPPGKQLPGTVSPAAGEPGAPATPPSPRPPDPPPPLPHRPLPRPASAPAPARADSIFWTGPTSANWTHPSSWSSGTTPGALDDVTLGLLPAPNQGNAYTVTVNSPQAANSLTINAGTATLLSNLGAGNTF